MMTTSTPLVGLTRRVSFSSGHRYWLVSRSEEENRRLFGAWASPYNHGHNYILDVTTRGAVDPATGMVVNIKDIDDVLQQNLVARFDGKSLNDEVEHFRDHAPTVENILLYVREVLDGQLPQEAKLTGLRLEEMPTLWGELRLQNGDWKMTLTRTYEFAASHRLHVESFSHDQNIALFGKCNNPAGHGHNYIVEVTVGGEPDPETGMSVDLGELDRVVEEEVVDRYDHKNLNCDLPEFEGKPTTSEAVVLEIFNRLKDRVPARLVRVRLHETARNIFEASAGE
jgi:6-pyruvoyltetrahydropterin/6-carboxytetrahydropterin synthase